MQDTIKDLIVSTCSDEFVDAVSSTKELLDKFSLEGYDNELEDIVAKLDNYTNEDVVDLTYKITFDYINKILDTHGVEISTECNLYRAIDLAEAIYRLQDWEDHSEILRITNTDVDDIEKFALLVALVTIIPKETVYTLITEVSRDLIVNINNLHAKYDTNDKIEVDPEYVQRLRLLKRYLAEKHSVGNILLFNVVKQGINLGAPFEYYYNLMKRKLMASTDADYLAYQFIALLAAGSDSTVNMLEWWRNNNSELVSSLDLLTKVDTILKVLIVDWDKWVAESVKPGETV